MQARVKKVAFVAFLAVLCGCRAGGCAAATLGDVVGATGDAHCDRRFVSGPDAKDAPFCQEIVDTLAASEFKDDCSQKHTARADDGRCPRDRVIAGCKLHKQNDDGSEVLDWFYDVGDLEADGAAFEPPLVRTKDDVRAQCNDPKRYEEGATFVDP
jgi:hypothetical protein